VSAARLSGASHDGRNRRLQPLNPLWNPPRRRDDDSGSRVPVTAGTDLVLMLTCSGDPVDPAAAGSLATTAPYPCTLADDGDTLRRSSPAPSPSSSSPDAELDSTGIWGVPVKPFRSASLMISSATDAVSSSSTTTSNCWRWSIRSRLPPTGPHPLCRREREFRRTDVGTGRYRRVPVTTCWVPAGATGRKYRWTNHQPTTHSLAPSWMPTVVNSNLQVGLSFPSSHNLGIPSDIPVEALRRLWLKAAGRPQRGFKHEPRIQ